MVSQHLADYLSVVTQLVIKYPGLCSRMLDISDELIQISINRAKVKLFGLINLNTNLEITLELSHNMQFAVLTRLSVRTDSSVGVSFLNYCGKVLPPKIESVVRTDREYFIFNSPQEFNQFLVVFNEYADLYGLLPLF